jgi:D-alanyl-D-alanine carboxypeptidase (penicillin-binding protein 5/6)
MTWTRLRRAPTPVLATVVAGALLAAPATSAAAAAAAPIGGASMGSASIVVAPGVPKPPDVADSFVVVDLSTGGVIAAKGAHVKRRPASTLKTLTALTLLPLLDKATVYTARDADVRVEGTRVGMIAGTTYTVDDLFNGMLLPSANDATSGLVAVAGGQKHVAALMTNVARSLQADDTSVVDPSGLDEPGQYSSAYDLALIGRAAMQRPDFRAYVSKTHAQFPGRPAKAPGQPRPTMPIENKNQLLLDHYPGLVGVKVGYTSKAGNTYIGQADRDGHSVLVTLMHIHGKSEVAERKLLDWAFVHVATAAPVGQLVSPAPTATPSAPASASTSPSATPLTAGLDPTGSGTSSPMLWLGLALGIALVAWLAWTVASGVRRRRQRDNPLGLPPLRGR